MMNNYSLIRKSSLLTLLFLFSFSIKAQHLLEALEGYDEYGDMVECKTISNIITAKHSTTNQTETGSFDANRWKSLPYGVYDVTEEVISYGNVIDDSNKPICETTITRLVGMETFPCYIGNNNIGGMPAVPIYICPPPQMKYETFEVKGTAFVQRGYWACNYGSDGIKPTNIEVEYKEGEIISYTTHRCINRN